MAKRCAGYGAACFVMGLGLGAAAGLLLAPHSGEETRRRINRKVERSVERGKDYVSDQQEAIRRKSEDLMAEGRKRAEGLRDKARDWADRTGFTRASES